MPRISILLALLGTVFPVLSAPQSNPSAEKAKDPIWTDGAKAAEVYPDFRLQGEYVGTKNGDSFGVQVACLEGKDFLVTTYPGGLPGEGSEGKDFSYEVQDKAQVESRIRTHGLRQVLRTSPTMDKKPPKGAIILYDGSPDHLMTGKHEGKFFWAGARTKVDHGDMHMHLEFRTPFRPSLPLGHANRGNSGIYLQQRYEIQICDSFGLGRTSNGLPYEPAAIDSRWCGCVYHVAPVDIRMDFPPLRWQTYDIDFTAPRFKGEQKVNDARVTVRHNGVLVVNNLSLKSGTGRKSEEKEVARAFTYFQSHGNPVAFRNVWMLEK